MIQYLSAFFIIVSILTILVFSINPTTHKNISIADSKSKVVAENKELVVDRSAHLENKDNLQNTSAGFDNVDNFNNIDANFYNQDNFSNTDASIDFQNNVENQGGFGLSDIDYESQQNDVYDFADEEQEYPQPDSLPEPKREVPAPIKTQENNPNTVSPIEESKEEMISWNIWRSNLGNKIADDYEQWAPDEGTYLFYFVVDNQRQISKPVVIMLGFSVNDEARMAAYRYLYSLQGNQILQFPEKTKRKKVSAVYSIYISSNTTSRSLDSSDFSDYEIVK